MFYNQQNVEMKLKKGGKLKIIWWKQIHFLLFFSSLIFLEQQVITTFLCDIDVEVPQRLYSKFGNFQNKAAVDDTVIARKMTMVSNVWVVYVVHGLYKYNDNDYYSRKRRLTERI